MHYCCKGIGKCCKGCCDCLGSCCSTCGKCCASCDKCVSSCCKGCSKLFDRPFSSCLFLQFVIMFCPFVICWAIAFSNLSASCNHPVQAHLIIQGVCLLINFLLIFYLMYKYSTPQPSLEGKSYSQKLAHLICYDFVICGYIFFLAFEFAWNIVGHVWLSNSDCTSTVLESIDLLGIIVNWVYLGAIFLYLFFVGCLHCCEECGCEGCCTCFYYLCCCCCCFGKAKFGEKKEERNRTSRRVNGWMQGFLRIQKFVGGDKKEVEMKNEPSAPPAPPGYGQGHAGYPPAGQVMYPPVPPPGYNPNYNPGYHQGYYPQQFK